MIAAVVHNECLDITISDHDFLKIEVCEEQIMIDLKKQKARLSDNLAFCDTDRKNRKIEEGHWEVVYLPLYQKVDLFLYLDDEGYRDYTFYNAKDKVFWISDESIGFHQRKDSLLRLDMKNREVTSLTDEGFHFKGRRKNKTTIEFGCTICFRAVKVMIHDDFIAINHPCSFFKSQCKLFNYDLSKEDPRPMIAENKEYSGFQFVQQRSAVQLHCPVIPDFKMKEIHFSLISAGSSITMGMASLAVAFLMGKNSAAMIVMPCMMIFSVLFWPLVQLLKDRQDNHKTMIKKQQWIDDLIQQWSQELQFSLNQLCGVLNKEYPDGLQMSQGRYEGSRLKRGKDDPLFAIGCLGQGMVNVKYEIIFEEEETRKKNQWKKLFQQRLKQQNISMTGRVEWDLKQFSITGVVLDEKSKEDFLLFVIFSFALHHDCHDFKMSWVGDVPERLQSVIRWLPHFKNDDGGIRHYDTNELPLKREGDLHWILSTELYPFELKENEFLWQISDSLHSLSVQCQVVITVLRGKGTAVENNGDLLQTFSVDEMPCSLREMAVTLMHQVNTERKNGSLTGLQQITHSERIPWDEHDCTDSIRIPLGLQRGNQKVVLDLHEHGDGPHGLIAGMTGSGKSRLIQTLVLSAAWHYSPEQVQFVIIDYKGGSCAELLKYNGRALPHLCAVMNNIEVEGFGRSLYYLKQESLRRQRILLDAQKKTSQAVSDLDQYIRLQRKDQRLEPLSHCIIIIDEFAELKVQQPEMLQDLIRICRIGRSLGLHLILATQRPEGIVDEQMRSNFNFRICLKVAQKQDSLDMVQVPDAGMIHHPGEFYLRTSSDLIHGQSAWLSAKKDPDKVVSLIGITGKIVDSAAVRTGDPVMQDQWMIKQILKQADHQNIRIRPLCPEELSPVFLEDLAGWGKRPVIGLVDDLENHRLTELVHPYSAALIYVLKPQRFHYLNLLARSLQVCHCTLVILDPLKQIDPVDQFNVAEQISLQEVDRMQQMLQWIERKLKDQKALDYPMFIAVCSPAVLIERMDCLDLLIRFHEQGSALNLFLILLEDPAHTLPSRLIQPIRFRLVLMKASANQLSALFDQKVNFNSTELKGVVKQENPEQMMLGRIQTQGLPQWDCWHLPVCPDYYPESWFNRQGIILGADPVEGTPVRLDLKKGQCLWVIGFDENSRIRQQMSQSPYPVLDMENIQDSTPCICVCTVQQFNRNRHLHSYDLSFLLWVGPGLHQQMIFSIPPGFSEKAGMRYYFHYGKCLILQGEKYEKRDHALF